MKEVDIQAPIFADAYINNAYSKTHVVEILNDIIAPNNLDDSDETIIGWVLLSVNDSKVKNQNLNIEQIVKKIEQNRSSANTALVNKIKSNPQIRKQLETQDENKRKENRKWYFALFILIALIALGLAYKFNMLKIPVIAAKEGAKVVVLDTARLAYAATVPVIENPLTPEQAQQYSMKYRDGLQREIKKYTDSGYIIIHRSTVYTTNESNDITDTLIKNLGLKPVGRKEFDSDYSNRQKYDVLTNFAQSNVNDYERAVNKEETEKYNQAAEKQMNTAEIVEGSNGQAIDLE